MQKENFTRYITLRLENHELLQDNVNLKEAESLQNKYNKLLSKKDCINKDILIIEDIKLIAGTDISYFNQNDKEWGVACAVLWDAVKNIMVCNTIANDVMRFSYQPGFLGFRECRLMASAIAKLPHVPDVIMCDGHGIIHPKRFGEAVQLGLALDIPTFGVAKNPFIGISSWKDLNRRKGEKTPIWDYNPCESSLISNDLIGYASCLNDGMKPVFISKGYKIDIELANELALITSQKHRQPEPLYLAHHFSHLKIDSLKK